MIRLTFFLLLISTVLLFSQVNSEKYTLELTHEIQNSSPEILVWVFFKDKGGTEQMYYSNPQSAVSSKSLTRRTKVMGRNSLITFEDVPVNPNYLSAISKMGIDIKHRSKWFNGISAVLSKSELEKIAALPFVKKIDIVYKLKKQKEIKTGLIDEPINKPSGTLGAHSFDYGSSFTQLSQINIPAVHDMGFTGQGVTVCVMDAGFSRLSHEVFNNMNIIAAWDFVNNDPDVGDGSDMGEGSHGTQTLSTIGGFKEGSLIGPAFSSDFILAKTENTDSETPVEEDNWIAAVEWADSIGVDVTSTSLGYVDFDPPFTSYTWASMDGNTARITIAADLAAARGIVVVNSAGNDGFNSSHNTLGAPADGDSVIAIGAVSSSGTRVSFSSVGNTVDGRIKPDLMAMGSVVTVASPSSNTGYTTASGTSFSCPLAAGVAAVLLSFNPSLTPIEVRDVLRSTASNSAAPNREMGWGIINALSALQNSTPQDTTPPVDITDLTIIDAASNSLTLQWTVPVDTSVRGVIDFDIRYSTSPITDLALFNTADSILFDKQPGDAGTFESIIKDSLSPNTVYYFSIRSVDFWGNWSGLSNNAFLSTLDIPIINASPDSIVNTVLSNSSVTDTVTISNVSSNPSTLDYSVILMNNNFPLKNVQMKTIPLQNETDKSSSTKYSADVNNGQSIEGSGGPDTFGYQWIDSNEPGGPAFEWNDISTTGTLASGWQPTGSFDPLDEGYVGPISMGIPFKFYGVTKTSLYISSNGFISFQPITSNTFTNSTIPDAAFPNEIIAGFWDDLDGKSTGKVYYKEETDRLIIQYTDWMRFSGTGTYTFQVVLFSSGKIIIYYSNMNATLNSSTIGIENSSGSDGLQVANNASYVTNSLALQFSSEPDWVSANNLSGTLFSGNSANIEVTMNSADLPLGEYTMDMIVASNDPGTPIITIPLKMNLSDVIPVELADFSANVIENNVRLSWKTITETNNRGFTVQRKINSDTWNDLVFIKGKGTASEINEYQYTDKELPGGKYFYRLLQTDFDGSANFSGEIEVTVAEPTQFALYNNYPNPFNPVTKIKYQIPEASSRLSLNVTLKVYDVLGNEVATLVNGKKQAGIYEIEFDASSLASGVYIVRMTAGNFRREIKLNLLK